MLILLPHGGSSSSLRASIRNARAHGVPHSGINKKLSGQVRVGGNNVHDGAFKLDTLMIAQVGRRAGLANKLRGDQFNLGVKSNLTAEKGKELGNGAVDTIDGSP